MATIIWCVTGLLQFSCELCGRAATLQCPHCRVTYYCGHDHLQVDWEGIHEKICQLVCSSFQSVVDLGLIEPVGRAASKSSASDRL